MHLVRLIQFACFIAETQHFIYALYSGGLTPPEKVLQFFLISPVSIKAYSLVGDLNTVRCIAFEGDAWARLAAGVSHGTLGRFFCLDFGFLLQTNKDSKASRSRLEYPVTEILGHL
jgi:hypothetical protein